MKKYLIITALAFMLVSCTGGVNEIRTHEINSYGDCKVLETYNFCAFDYCTGGIPRNIYSTVCGKSVKTQTTHPVCVSTGKTRMCHDEVDETTTQM